MSLDTLISTVATNLNIDDKAASDIILKFADVCGRIEFSNSTLIGNGFQKEEVTIIIESLIDNDYISRYISYTCHPTEFTETTSPEHLVCESCGKNFSFDIENHEYVELFKVTERFVEDIEKKKEMMLKDIIMNGYLPNFKYLIRDKAQVIPFLGAGIAMPLGVPGWRQLLLDMKEFLKDPYFEKRYTRFFDEGDYLNALSYLKKNSVAYSTDEQIKDYIADVVQTKLNMSTNEDKHNIKDIINLNADFYITTNYETSINRFINNGESPEVFKEIESVPKLMRERKQKVIHLHGVANRPSTMIVTQEDYEELYNDPKYKHMLTGIMSNRVLLFIGWSFADKFFKDLYTKIRDMVGGEHYIIIANVDDYDAQEFAKDGLRTIGIKVKEDEDGYIDKEDLVRVMKQLLAKIAE
jgi:hypothetical protein